MSSYNQESFPHAASRAAAGKFCKICDRPKNAANSGVQKYYSALTAGPVLGRKSRCKSAGVPKLTGSDSFIELICTDALVCSHRSLNNGMNKFCAISTTPRIASGTLFPHIFILFLLCKYSLPERKCLNVPTAFNSGYLVLSEFKVRTAISQYC